MHVECIFTIMMQFLTTFGDTVPILFTFTASSCPFSLVLLHQPTVLCPSLVLAARDTTTQYMGYLFQSVVEKGCTGELQSHSSCTYLIIQAFYVFATLSICLLYAYLCPNSAYHCLVSGLPKLLFPGRSICCLPNSFPGGFSSLAMLIPAKYPRQI